MPFIAAKQTNQLEKPAHVMIDFYQFGFYFNICKQTYLGPFNKSY